MDEQRDDDSRKRNRFGRRRGLVAVTITVTLLLTALASAASAHEASPQGPEATTLKAIPAPEIDRTSTVGLRAPKGFKAVIQNRTPGLLTINTPTTINNSAGDCTIRFDAYDALQVQPYFALNQYAEAPWRESCKTVSTEFTASVHGHLHLDYLDPAVTLCVNYDEALGGSFARLIGNDPYTATCQAIDPLTEPRASPRTHMSNEVMRLRMYDYDGYQPFRLDRIRVKDQPIRLCAQPFEVGQAYEAGSAPGPGELAGATCRTLNPGYWDLSGVTSGSGLVTITGAEGSWGPLSFDNIGITDQS